ncbi:MAG: extracellular solute-binding protein [Anaerolineae bacterium]|nr:extracellular solute-binding protein [Anaerolineae bacterium]
MKRTIFVGILASLLLTVAPALAQMPFAGQTVIVATQSGTSIGGPVIDYREAWEAKTGGFVEIIQVPFGELFDTIMTDFNGEESEIDVIIYASDWSGDIMGGGHVLPIPDSIKEQIDWGDILPLYRERIADWGGVTYALPFDGDSHMLYYRKDLVSADSPFAAEFESTYGYPLGEPQTWAQYADVAQFFNGRDVETAGLTAPIFGVIEAQKPAAQSYWFLMTRAAGYAKVPGDPCFFFTCTDDAPMQPLVNTPGWVRGLQDWIDVSPYGPPNMIESDVTAVRRLFPSGQAVLALDWGDVGPLTVDSARSSVKDLAGFGVLPGGDQYWDPSLNNGAGDWVSPEGGVNRAPFIAFGGWVISVSARSDVADAALDFAAYMADKDLAGVLATTGGTGVNPLRASQFDNIDLWINAGFSEESAQEYLDAVRATIADPNAVLDLRIPGAAEYFAALDDEIHHALLGEVTAQEALDAVAAEWDAITDRFGRDEQLTLYRQSLGLE